MRDCPKSKSDWDVASHELQCVSPNSYHCMLDEQGEPIRQCLGKIWIQEGFCPEYNSDVGRIDVRPCSHDAGCPEQTYWSNEVYRYSTCISKEETDLIYNITTTLSSSSSSPGDDAHLSPTIIVVLVIVPILLILLISVVAIVIYRKRRPRQRNQNSERNDPQGIPVRERLLNERNDPQGIPVRERLLNETQISNPGNPRSLAVQSTKTSHSAELINIREDNRESISEQRHQFYKVGLEMKSSSINEPHSIHFMSEDHHGNTQTSDVEKLKRNGVLIYVSSSAKTINLGGRITQITNSGMFGQSTFIASLGQWDPEEDISLYIFRQPMDQVFSESDITSEKMEEMYKMTNMSPKSYFIMHFTTTEWKKYQPKLQQYSIFKIASFIEL